MKDTANQVGSRLTQLREKSGKNARQFALDHGIDPSQYAKAEKGLKGLSIEKLLEVTKACGVDINWLFYGADVAESETPTKQEGEHVLIHLLKRLGMSANKLEQTAGISQGTLSRSIKRGTQLSAATAAKIAKAFPNVYESWLISGGLEMSLNDDEAIFEEAKAAARDFIEESSPFALTIDAIFETAYISGAKRAFVKIR